MRCLRAARAGYLLEGTEAVLVEFPGSWLDIRDELVPGARRRSTACWRRVLCRCSPIRSAAARSYATRRPCGPLVERGALLCLNAGSLVGDHGAAAERTAWRLVEDGVVALAASDGHRARRPPVMDVAYEAAVARTRRARAAPLFDGSALPWVDAARRAAAQV